MHIKQKMLLALVLWAGMALPLWVGAEEQPAAEPQAQAAQPEQAASKAATQAAAKPEVFTSIELDSFIEQEAQAAADGKKIIKMGKPISFEAKMKRMPEERPMEYVYKALELIGVKPMPEVHHRMFVESNGGRIIPMYVEKEAVNRLNTGLKEEQKTVFHGYHVYSYAKGPAILVVDFAAIP